MKNQEQKESEKNDNRQINYIPLIILAVIMLFGFYLRLYHIAYPVIGYHNNKEEHYVGEARNFFREGFFKYGFFVPEIDYMTSTADPSGAHSDTFPLTPILVAIAFWIFGMNLTVARIIGVIFIVATIPLTYLIVRRLFKREDLAIVSAAITAMLPLTVFFSHNVELMNPGLFFFILSIYLFLKWIDEGKSHQLILTSLSFVIAGLTKYDFFIMGLLFVLLLIPFTRIWKYIIHTIIYLFYSLLKLIKKVMSNLTKPKQLLYVLLSAIIFPFRKIFKFVLRIISGIIRFITHLGTKEITAYLASILILLSFPAWYLYSNYIVAAEYQTKQIISPEKVDYMDISNASSWSLIEPYFSDSWTIIGTFFVLLGLIIAFYNFYKKREFPEKFIIALFLAAIVYFVILFTKIKGHNYHMYPMVPFFIILIAYFIVKIADFSKKLKVEGKGIPYLDFLIIAVILAILFFPMRDAASRQFDTQFYGLDVAGDYIKANKLPGERLMHSSHQAYGVLWHGDIKGTRGIPDNVTNMKFAEEKLNATWIFMYNWDFASKIGNAELWSYIKSNYELKQYAFVLRKQGNQIVPETTYMLFRKGGTFDENSLNTLLSGKKQLFRDYELTRGIDRLYYYNL